MKKLLQVTILIILYADTYIIFHIFFNNPVNCLFPLSAPDNPSINSSTVIVFTPRRLLLYSTF